MSKKLILIIVGLFILQYALISYIEFEVKPDEITNKKISEVQNNSGNLNDDYSNKLDLRNKKLTEVPSFIYKIKNIEEIDLSSNLFETFPYELLQLENLKGIKLNNNQLKNLDFSQFENSNIEYLELNQNAIKWIKGLEKLDKLVRISLVQNELTVIPNINSSSLQSVALGYNNIQRLNGEIGENVLQLSLTHNKIKKIDIAISEKEKLRVLNLQDNYEITEFPYDVLRLIELKELNLNGCNIISINDKALPAMNQLEKLYLRKNKILELNLGINDFKTLKELDLSDNRLSKVRIESKTLEALLLRDNSLIHENLSLKTENLSELNLYNNSLSDLPESSIDALYLTYINLYDNLMGKSKIDEIKMRLNIN